MWRITIQLHGGPFITAFGLTLVYKGKSGVIELFKRGLDRDFDRKYGFFAIFSLPAVIGGAMVIGQIFANHQPELIWMDNYLIIPILPIVVLFIAGPLQEEFGWRGLVQTRLTITTSG